MAKGIQGFAHVSLSPKRRQRKRNARRRELRQKVCIVNVKK